MDFWLLSFLTLAERAQKQTFWCVGIGLRKLVLDTLRARFLKLSLVDQVAGHLELAIELVGIVNKARNLGVVILFGKSYKQIK